MGWLLVLHQCSFLDVNSVLGLYKILSLGEAGQRVHGNSTIFSTSCIKLFQTLKSYFLKNPWMCPRVTSIGPGAL